MSFFTGSRRLFLLPLVLISCAVLHAADGAGIFTTPVKAANIDPDVYAAWVDGTETALGSKDNKGGDRSANWVLATETGVSGHSGISFGPTHSPGVRHLRIGFKEAVSVGSVLMRGGVQVSVLKPDAAYPGNMADDSQWIPASRIKDGKVSRDEAGRDNYILWTLPQTVKTRAVRFTHNADVTEKDYAGWLGGATLLSDRFANMAPQATAVASANERNARKINAGAASPGWEQWANISLPAGERAAIVSTENPEWVMLTWNAPVTLRGLSACFAGFGDAEAQTYTGAADVHPREAPESAWKTIKSFSGLRNRYPSTLPLDWLDFGEEITTRAIRLRMTKSIGENGHPHTHGHTRDGKRVWIGELLALQPIHDAKLETALLPAAREAEKPPIPVKFTLPEAGWVTLVIEDASGKRVRNLVADTFFEKGENTAWWDGSNDLERDPSAAKHGLYYIPTQFVAPGTYRVRGLWRKQVDVKYEFGVYSGGTTPWETNDRTGGWLANHSPPSSVLFVPNAPDGDKTRPAILIGSYVSEGTAGLAWVDLDGKKWRGQNWIGGNWTGAPYLARDAGAKAVAENYAYVASAWTVSDNNKNKEKGEIRVTALTAKGDKAVTKYEFVPVPNADGKVSWEAQIGGLAARDGVVVFSLPTLNRIVFVNAQTGKVEGETALENPHGLAFDAQGNLVALSGKSIVRFAAGATLAAIPAPTMVATRLDSPTGVTVDAAGYIFVTDRGQSNQVKIFSADGKLLRSIGHFGPPHAGAYDAAHMNNPRGVTVDSSGRLWVAEEDSQPKRVSVWNTTDGSLIKAFYGPAEYGGGGVLDPRDKSKFYYNGMEFHIDWEKGIDTLAAVFYRPNPKDLKLAERCGVPQTAIYANDKRYFTDSHNSNPTGGHGAAFIFADRNGVAVPVAGAGRANEWELLKTPEFAGVWPKDTEPKANPHTDHAAFFIWSDLNGDGLVQPNEITLTKATNGGVTVQRDLSIVVARLGGKCVRFVPKRFNEFGAPIYEAGETIVEAANVPQSSGGDEALVGADGWSIHTNAPKPFKADAIGGAKNGTPQWSYPSLWPGLHASHEAPVPDRPGMIVGHTRLLGDFVTVRGGEQLFFVNANDGPIHVFTADGLYVAQLFQDMRTGRPWVMPSAQRGMLLNEMTPSDENFWPNVEQSPDGNVYLTTGRPSCIVRVDGLDSIHRINAFDVAVSADDLTRAQEFFARAEAARQAAQGRGVLIVRRVGGDAGTPEPVVDGKMDDWSGAGWVDIDKRGSAAYFNSNSKPYDVTGAVAISGDKLFAAWRTGDKDLLRNAGDTPNALFKTGGALDLMIGTNPAADPKRAGPVEGDLRLLVTLVGGKTRALLYRAVVPGTKERVPFSSPWRTIYFDRVEDVSDKVQLAGADGNYEIAIPLAILNFKPTAGQTLKGDIGILRGSGAVTTQRVYWSNKATAIVADVPSEAELRPNLWGRWEIK